MSRHINGLGIDPCSHSRKQRPCAPNMLHCRTEETPGEKRAFSYRLLDCTHNSRPNLSGSLKKVLAGLFLALSVFSVPFEAAADEPSKPKAPDFVPFVVDQQQDAAARTYLNGLTFKDAAPLVAWLNELQARAKGQWEADHAPKPVEPPK